MASVRLEGVSKTFEGGVTAVHNVTVNIEDKEFVVLVGPSGCGKSTTLRIIAGLEEATSGSIYIDDKLVNDVPPKDRDIAMVFQNYALYPHMTVYENMAFGLKLRKFPKKEIQARVQEAAAILDIAHLLDRKPKALSGGQRQRVAVGRAIVRKPKVFLFDEPLSNLDAKLRVQMRTEIIKLHQRLEATMIYVTHDQTEAMTMADRIVLMKDGFVQQIDAPLAIYDNPSNKFVAGFIGSPAMNFFKGEIEKNGKPKFKADGDAFEMSVSAETAKRLAKLKDRKCEVGIRPEHLSLHTASKPPKGSGILRGKVEVVEPMGSETYLYFTTGSSAETRVARISSGAIPEPGHKVNLAFSISNARYFNGADGSSV